MHTSVGGHSPTQRPSRAFLDFHSSGPLQACISPHAPQRVLIAHRGAAAEHERVVRVLLLAAA